MGLSYFSGGDEYIVAHQKRQHSQAQVKTALKELIGAEAYDQKNKNDLDKGDCLYHKVWSFPVGADMAHVF
jgi:hypothetical protein